MKELFSKKLRPLLKLVKSLLIAIFIAASQMALAQSSYTLFNTIDVEARLISSDQLGNVYLVVKNNIYKYDRNGEFINQYSNNRYGEISSIDATDPYKIVVFYEDFRVIVILDNQLSENGSPLDLQFADFDQPILACRAYNTGIWLFDQLMYNIYRLTLSMRAIQTSGNLTQILQYEIHPNFMVEYNNTLYVNNPMTGILVFDQYGTYVKNIAITGLNSFQVTEKAIYYIKENQIVKYKFKSLETETLPLPEEEIAHLTVDKNRLFLLTNKSVKIYDYKGQ